MMMIMMMMIIIIKKILLLNYTASAKVAGAGTRKITSSSAGIPDWLAIQLVLSLPTPRHNLLAPNQGTLHLVKMFFTCNLRAPQLSCLLLAHCH